MTQKLSRHCVILAAALSLGGTFGVSSLSAQSVTTKPVGAMTYAVSAGAIGARVTTSIAIPLQDEFSGQGAGRGVASAVTTTTITIANAGWTVNALSNASSPYLVRVATGAQAGRYLSISSNTADTITTSSVTTGLVAGTDIVEIVPVDTLNTLFGSTTLIGAASSANADIVYTGSSSLTGYYYNTTLSRWVQAVGPTTDRGNIQLPPQSIVRIGRIGPALSITMTGSVPAVQAAFVVGNTGNSFTHTGFPVAYTLNSLAINTKIPGWVSSTTSATADLIGLPSGGGWTYYYHNGTQWRILVGPTTDRGSVAIGAGTPILITKRGSTAGTSYFTNTLPYTL